MMTQALGSTSIGVSPQKACRFQSTRTRSGETLKLCRLVDVKFQPSGETISQSSSPDMEQRKGGGVLAGYVTLPSFTIATLKSIGARSLRVQDRSSVRGQFCWGVR